MVLDDRRRAAGVHHVRRPTAALRRLARPAAGSRRRRRRRHQAGRRRDARSPFGAVRAVDRRQRRHDRRFGVGACPARRTAAPRSARWRSTPPRGAPPAASGASGCSRARTPSCSRGSATARRWPAPRAAPRRSARTDGRRDGSGVPPAQPVLAVSSSAAGSRAHRQLDVERHSPCRLTPCALRSVPSSSLLLSRRGCGPRQEGFARRHVQAQGAADEAKATIDEAETINLIAGRRRRSRRHVRTAVREGPGQPHSGLQGQRQGQSPAAPASPPRSSPSTARSWPSRASRRSSSRSTRPA